MSRLSLAVLVVLVAGVSVAGCGLEEDEDPTKDPNLVTLKQEKMAAFRPPGGRLALNLELTDHYSLGKPIAAQVRHVFAYRDRERASNARKAALDAALGSGWHMNLKREDPSAWLFGAKKLGTGDATLTIHQFRDEDGYKVSVALEHVPCPRALCGAAADDAG